MFRLAAFGASQTSWSQACNSSLCENIEHSALLQVHRIDQHGNSEDAARRSSSPSKCSLRPAQETCSDKTDGVPKGAVQILNSNIQEYKRNNYADKFKCFGEDYVGEFVELMAFEEIDSASALQEVFDSAGGHWKGAVCGVAKDSCSADHDTGSGIGWNTAKFKARESAKPAVVLAEAIALENNAWGVQISDADEQGTSWGPQFRKLVYAVLEPTSGEAPAMIFGGVHIGRKNGPNDPSGKSQGENVGKVILSAMEKNNIQAAVVCGDWNPSWDDATKAFEEQFGGKTTTRCYEHGCDDEIQCVAVGGHFSKACLDPAEGWVADDHPVAAVQVQFHATNPALPAPLKSAAQCSLRPATKTCSEKTDGVPEGAVQILNSNIQEYKRGNYADKFKCFGEDYVGEFVELIAFEEIDSASALQEVFDSAGGHWKGAVCGVGKDSCSADHDTGSGIGWNTAKFKARESAKPAVVLAEAIALENNAWGVQISDPDEQGTSWGPQFRKLVYAVLEPTSGKAPAMIFGGVHIGRKNGPNDPSGKSQGENVGKVILSAMEKNNIQAAVVCGDWNPYWDDATKAFEDQFGGNTTTRCYDQGCDDEIQCVAVGGHFSKICLDPAVGWVADDHPVAAVQLQFHPTKALGSSHPQTVWH